jgi:putative membrane protein
VILAHLAVPLGSASPDPSVVSALSLAGAAYAIGFARRHRASGRRVGTRQAVAFAAALAVLALALASPLEAVASALFTAHMVQHLLLIVVAAPLLVSARPGTVLLAALPPRWRRRAHRLSGARLVRVSLVRLAHPVVAWVVAAAVLWAWHLPSLYQLALAQEAVHVLEHATLLATAGLTWWLVGTRRGPFAVGRPAAVGLLFATALQSGALGAVLSLASAPLYPVHAAGAAAFDLTPLADQQLAGVLMWVPPWAVYLTTMVVLLFRWFAHLEADSPRPVPSLLAEERR